MDKDLFGRKVVIKKRRTRLETTLNKYDRDTFDERLSRLEYLNKIFPKDYSIAGSMDTVFVFAEAKMTFINGEFISTILLAQAFIEKKIQVHYAHLGFDKIASRGLKAIIRHARQNNILHTYLLDKIDDLRKKRNPFSHLKPADHNYNLDKRFMIELSKSKDYKAPSDILEQDAKEALSLMYTIFITNLRDIRNE